MAGLPSNDSTGGDQVNARQSAADPAAGDAQWAGGTQRRAAGPDVRQLLRSARRRRHARWLAVGLVLVAFGAVGTLLVRAGTLDELFGAEPAAAPPADPPAAIATTPAPMLDPSRPFAATPSADWADGADGIKPPPAKPVNGFTAEQVAAATAQVREALVASRLDPRMIVEHDPEPYLDMLAPDARRQLEPLFTGGREPQVQSLVSLIAKDHPLLPVEPKVRGEMRVSAGEAGEVVVHTNYVFVYAFEPAGPTRLVDAMNMLVVVRADVDYIMRAGERWTASSQGLWYDEATGYAYSIGCEAYREGYLAPAATERAVTANGTRDPQTYFDPTSPLPATSGCPN